MEIREACHDGKGNKLMREALLHALGKKQVQQKKPGD